MDIQCRTVDHLLETLSKGKEYLNALEEESCKLLADGRSLIFYDGEYKGKSLEVFLIDDKREAFVFFIIKTTLKSLS